MGGSGGQLSIGKAHASASQTSQNKGEQDAGTSHVGSSDTSQDKDAGADNGCYTVVKHIAGIEHSVETRTFVLITLSFDIVD